MSSSRGGGGHFWEGDFRSYFVYESKFNINLLTEAMSFQMPFGTGKSIQQNNKSSRKVAKMCAVIVTSFVLLWTPYHIALIYFDSSSNPALALNFISASFVLADVNSCVNPIVYGFMWKPMKDAITNVCM